MTYTLRRTWPDKENDYVFRHDGKDVGRCYLDRYPGGDRWRWTIYGTNLTLDDAKAKFKEAFDRLSK